MQKRVEGRRLGYEGPCTVTVRAGEWRGFDEHAPAWWPRDFPAPDHAVVQRVNHGLQRLLRV